MRRLVFIAVAGLVALAAAPALAQPAPAPRTEPTVADVVTRVRDMFGTGWWSVADIVMLIVIFGFISAVFRVLQAMVRLVTGKV